MKYIGVTWWGKTANSYDDDKTRYRLFDIAFGKGSCPLAGSKHYYRHFLTVSLRNRLFRVEKNTMQIYGWYFCILGIEISFKTV